MGPGLEITDRRKLQKDGRWCPRVQDAINRAEKQDWGGKQAMVPGVLSTPTSGTQKNGVRLEITVGTRCRE